MSSYAYTFYANFSRKDIENLEIYFNSAPHGEEKLFLDVATITSKIIRSKEDSI